MFSLFKLILLSARRSTFSIPLSAGTLLLGPVGCLRAATQSYTVEEINDPWFAKYPMPAPVHVCTYSFVVTNTGHEEVIPVTSKSLRNLSVTVQNRGSNTVRAPYLFGPNGWDFRSQEKLVKQKIGRASCRERV